MLKPFSFIRPFLVIKLARPVPLVAEKIKPGARVPGASNPVKKCAWHAVSIARGRPACAGAGSRLKHRICPCRAATRLSVRAAIGIMKTGAYRTGAKPASLSPRRRRRAVNDARRERTGAVRTRSSRGMAEQPRPRKSGASRIICTIKMASAW
jgi:hypothetical protein